VVTMPMDHTARRPAEKEMSIVVSFNTGFRFFLSVATPQG
jgi:hypothetical protein